jgi:hypothetical protein
MVWVTAVGMHGDGHASPATADGPLAGANSVRRADGPVPMVHRMRPFFDPSPRGRAPREASASFVDAWRRRAVNRRRGQTVSGRCRGSSRALVGHALNRPTVDDLSRLPRASRRDQCALVCGRCHATAGPAQPHLAARAPAVRRCRPGGTWLHPSRQAAATAAESLYSWNLTTLPSTRVNA